MIKKRALILLGLLGVMAVAVPFASAETYTYDALGRLVQVVQDNGKTVNYALDKAGNRVSVASPAARAAMSAQSTSCPEMSGQPLTWTVAGKTCTSGDSFVPAVGSGVSQSFVDPGRFIWSGTATYVCSGGTRILQSASCN